MAGDFNTLSILENFHVCTVLTLFVRNQDVVINEW